MSRECSRAQPRVPEHETLSLFSFLKRKPPAQPQEPRKPRACLPTYVTKERVILSKAAAHLRDSYEMRLAQSFAAAKGLKLMLAVRPSVQMEPSLSAYLKQNGVQITEAQMEDYSVYFGHTKGNGQDGDGWVLGHSAALTSLTQSTRSLWLRDRLRIGATFSGNALNELESAVLKENGRVLNVDGENARDALMSLIAAAKADGGTLFIQ
jgi:hypothetical protein